MDIQNGTCVKMICGDRDRVGEYSFVSNIQPDGRCEFHGSCDMCYGNVNEIGNGKRYVLVPETEIPGYLKGKAEFYR